ncbi:MAG: hypothetical protein IJ134_00165, partial [Bacilli bacterium]|nr:hypothetical protein [Bacilli bacterium]
VTVPHVTLKAPGDKVEYRFKVVNEGEITGYINELTNIGIGTITYGAGETLTAEQKTSFQNDIQVTLTYNDQLKTRLAYNDELKQNEEKELILTIQYIKRETEQVLPTSDVTFTNITASITYGQDETSKSGNGMAPSAPEVKGPQSIILKVGDLVEMIPSELPFNTDKNLTGYTDVQEITPKELKLWRVIRVNNDGTYDAVSEYVSSTKVYFRSTTGYKNFVGYLNVLASKYKNDKYTVGTRHMGYNGQTQNISNTSYFDGTTTKASNWGGTNTITSAEEKLGKGDDLYTTDYELVKKAYGGTDQSYARAYMVNTSTYMNYWLASRQFAGSSDNFSFYGRDVTSNGNASAAMMRQYLRSKWTYDNPSYALRPIITLKSDLVALGSGTSGDPYVLQ